MGALKAVVRRLEHLAARLGGGQPEAAASEAMPDEADIKDYCLRVLVEFEAARLKDNALGGGVLQAYRIWRRCSQCLPLWLGA